jgi:glycosyltransferase involved in cell wall biosynthesis
MHALDAIHHFIAEGNLIHFVIIGQGEQRVALEKRIIDLGLSSYVTLLGHVQDAAAYLKSLDIFLLSSVKEGLPYVILEAGQAEVPVIATEVGGILEMTHKGSLAHIVEPKNHLKIVGALEYIRHHPTEARQLATQFKRYISHHYSVDNMLISTRKLYGDAV